MCKRFFGFVGVGLILVCAGIGGGVVHTRRQAKMLLENLKGLDKNIDPASSFSAFKERHRDQLAKEECANDLCQYEFVVNNWIIATLHLAPRTEIRATVTLFHGGLDVAGVEYTSGIFKANSPIVHVQEDFCADRSDIPCDHFGLNPHGRNVAPTWNGIVEFGQSATDEQKRAAWTLNLDCLASHYGCKDISQLLPEIWKATGPGLVSSRMRSTADSITEASQPLSE
jgi:hypothetical protein